MNLPPAAEAIKSPQREKIRRGILALAESRLGEYTLADVRERARCDARAVSTLVRLYRAGKMPPLCEPWGEDGPVPRRPATKPPKGGSPAPPPAGDRGPDPRVAELVDEIDAAEDPKALAGVARRVTRMLALGQLANEVARALRDLIQEQRQGLKDARAIEPPTDPGRTALVSESALELARAYDYLVSPARRERAQAVLAELLEEDLAEPVGTEVEAVGEEG